MSLLSCDFYIIPHVFIFVKYFLSNFFDFFIFSDKYFSGIKIIILQKVFLVKYFYQIFFYDICLMAGLFAYLYIIPAILLLSNIF